MYKIPANTLFLGKNLIFVPECHSTNDLAIEMSQSNAAEGTVVITNSQTAGRGQRGNSWKAAAGMNFTFSIILRPKALALKDQFYLNVFISLAVYDYLKTKTEKLISVKWPNDVLIDGKKLCGILIENQLRENQFLNTIIGIGLNINQRNFDLTTATSLGIETQLVFDLAVELDDILSRIEARYFELIHGQYQKLMKHYLDILHWRGVDHIFSSKGGEFAGMIKGVDDVGRLLINTDNGTRVFSEKEIVYVR